MPTLTELIRRCDELDRLWGDARQAEEAKIRPTLEAPTDPGPLPEKWDRPLTDEQKLWCNRSTARSNFYCHVWDLAEAVPYVKDLDTQRRAVVEQIWAQLGTRNPPIVAKIPGGLGCPLCDCPCHELPTDNRTGGSYIAVCEKDETHFVKWLPWGG